MKNILSMFTVKWSFLTLLLVLCLTSLISSCNNKANNAEHQAANPFDTTQTTAQSLTDDDRTKLLEAQGKKATTVNNEVLADKIANATGRLHVFCFWNLDNAESVKAMKTVNDLATQTDSTHLKITLVHVSPDTLIDKLNLFIRENQITEETFVLDKIDKNVLAAKVKKDFLTADQLPIIVIVNKEEGVFYFYNKGFDAQELKAVVQPFLL
jgi:hypothetical protein